MANATLSRSFGAAAFSVLTVLACGCSRENGDERPGAATRPEHPTVAASFLSAAEWRSLGPFRGGRTSAVAGDAKNPLVFYFGAAHGGVWKTIDAGLYWRNVSDDFFKTAPVGAIDVSLSHPSVIYVGMGEAITRQDLTPGDGVYKSTDAGETWTHVGLKETRHIAKIRIHPTNPDIVHVAAVGDIFGQNEERGVYRSRDGGKTWQRVLYKSAQASAVDLALDVNNPSVLYASLNQMQRLMWDEISGGPDSGLHKSTDGGDTWTEITRAPGLPQGVVGKIGVAVSPARSSRVWALVEADDGALFRSDDGGKTWQRGGDNREFRRWAASYMHVIADTTNADTVYIPSYDFWRSTDGGNTFTVIPMSHGDHHALWVDPRNSARMIEGNDGGATVTLNGGASWSTIHNQPTAALFGLAIDDHVPYRLYAAQNDNSHLSTPSRTGNQAIAWMDNESLPGGEGGQTAVTPDGNILYAADRAAIERYDRRTGQSSTVSVWPDEQFTLPPAEVKHRFYYTSPLLLSKHDPNVLYAAGSRVYRRDDTKGVWETISPDITRNRVDKMARIPGGPLTSMWSSLYWVSVAQALAESPLEKGEIWVGTDDGSVQMTRDAGQTWTEVSPKDLPEWTTIGGIDVSPHDRGTAYLAAHRYRVSDRRPYFFKTTDYGRTWQSIVQGIADEDFARVIREDPARPGLLYAGTETGVYVSFDAGAAWQPLRRGLPAVPVHFMQVKNNDLVIATHGRGFYILDNVASLRQITTAVTSTAAHLFEIGPVLRYSPVQVLSPRRGFRPGINYARASDIIAYEDRRLADGRVKRFFLNAGENPSGGAWIDYYLQRDAADATLTILDEKEQVIKRYSSAAKDNTWMPAAAGMNRFVWDLRYPGPREIPAPAGFVGAEYARAQTAVAPPGRYLARLAVDGQQHERRFEIRRDPRVAASDADLHAQFDLLTRIHQRIAQVAEAVERLRDVRKQLQSAPGAPASGGTLDTLTAIEGALTRLANGASFNLPPKGLQVRLSALTGEVGGGDAKPTPEMIAVFDELQKLVDAKLQELDGVLKGLPSATTASTPRHR